MCVIDVFVTYACVKPLTDRKAKTVLNGFIEIVNKSKFKPNELWFDKQRESYNYLIQKWLDDYVLMYLTYNESKSVVAERFIRTLKGKIYKQMKDNDSSSYHGYLNNLVDECNNSYHHRSIGKKPIHANCSACLNKSNGIIKLLNLNWWSSQDY